MSETHAPEPPEIGRRLRQIRHARGKSLSVVAGLAGISTGHLSHLERGNRALDRRSLIIKLADALDVAPSEITGSALTAPGERGDDSALTNVRLALLAASMDEPRGEVQAVEQLAARVDHVLAAQNDCRAATVGAALPSLIRDLHPYVGTPPIRRSVVSRHAMEPPPPRHSAWAVTCTVTMTRLTVTNIQAVRAIAA